MKAITMTFAFTDETDGKYLKVSSNEDFIKEFDIAYLMADVMECMLSTSSKVMFDFSKVRLMSSSCMGVLVNVAEKAKQMEKPVKFRFNSEIAQTIKNCNMDKILSMEEPTNANHSDR